MYSTSDRPLNNCLLLSRGLAAGNVAFCFSFHPMTIAPPSKCIKYSLSGCLPLECSGSLTGFLICLSPSIYDAYSARFKTSSLPKRFDGCLTETGVVVSVDAAAGKVLSWVDEGNGILVIADNLSDGLVVDFARTRSVVSKIPERTKSELKSSKSCLKGFANSLV